MPTIPDYPALPFVWVKLHDAQGNHDGYLAGITLSLNGETYTESCEIRCGQTTAAQLAAQELDFTTWAGIQIDENNLVTLANAGLAAKLAE